MGMTFIHSASDTFEFEIKLDELPKLFDLVNDYVLKNNYSGIINYDCTIKPIICGSGCECDHIERIEGFSSNVVVCFTSQHFLEALNRENLEKVGMCKDKGFMKFMNYITEELAL